MICVKKINDLKENIDIKDHHVKDPLVKLKEKIGPKNLRFTLRKVTKDQVKKTMDQMKKNI